MTLRRLVNGFSVVAVVIALAALVRAVALPDAGATLFARAQGLEEAGQIQLALRHYRLIEETHPESSFAARALLRVGDLLAARGRVENDPAILREAVAAYEKLATRHANDPLALEALFDGGELAMTNLRDFGTARRFYQTVLDRTRENSQDAAKATTKLGRIALEEGQKEDAQKLLQSVLRRWSNFSLAAAEAQYHLGVVYETLFENRAWAQRAYAAVLDKYPTSEWAAQARQRLGLLVYAETKGRRPARRVMIALTPLPDDAPPAGSIWDALVPLLAAHDIEASDELLLGWSLLPFYVGVDKTNPSRVVQPTFEPWENVLANAGLRYSVKGGGKVEEALRDLQDDLDQARLPLVYLEEDGQKRWSLVVGYDTDRGEVLLQERGARFDTLTVAPFRKGWNTPSSFGKPYTLVSTFVSRETPRPSLTPTPIPTPLPGATPMPQLDAPPAFVWDLPALSRRAAHQRATQRAATWLNRVGNERVALGPNGLEWLARGLELAARPVPRPEARQELARETREDEEFAPIEPPVRENEDGFGTDGEANPQTNPEATASATPTATPVPTPTPTPDPFEAADRLRRRRAERARSILGFFNEPARVWATRRRQAAAYLRLAARQTSRRTVTTPDRTPNSPNSQATPTPRPVASGPLERAAQALEQSADLVEEAAFERIEVSDTLTPADRAVLRRLATLVREAAEAERRAAREME